MVVQALIKRNTYRDSITLMTLAQFLKEQPGVEDAGAIMATEANRQLLQSSDLLPEQELSAQKTIGANDLLIVVRANDETRAGEALATVEQRLNSSGEVKASAGTTSLPLRSLEAALKHTEPANIALISVAGEHAWLEAEQALHRGLHVFLFSDNVPVEQERRLKELAIQNNLLLMGPDCGTAIINGVGLGFSNAAPRGSIGIIGASGTGMQQLICLLAAAGMGISQAIGTGGRDLSEGIDGLMMRQALKWLATDPQTEVIVLVSKPPAERVAREILKAAQIAKPVVAVFLGQEPARFAELAGSVHLAHTLTEGAELATALAGGRRENVPGSQALARYQSMIAEERAKLTPAQRYIRALYSGGTLCDEAMLTLQPYTGALASNIPLQPAGALAPGETFRGHTALDLGGDEFTKGRPHPMIDPSLRLHYLNLAGEDEETAVILLDIVLGFCSHPNPAEVYGPAITRLRTQALEARRTLPVIVSLCGTEADIQSLSRQRAAFEAVGALVFESNVEAALAAASLISIADSSRDQQKEVTTHD